MTSIYNSKKILRIHIIAWSIYIVYYISIYTIFYGAELNLNLALQVFFQKFGGILLFYLNALWILPKYLTIEKILYLIVTFSISIFLFIEYSYAINSYILLWLDIVTIKDIPALNQIISKSVVDATNFVIYALGYYFSQRVIQQQKELIQKDLELAEEKAKTAILEKEKSQAELAFLRSQINPHFMFNTLNMIYNKVRKANKEAGEIVIEFANMMRYATSTKLQADEVDVRGELDFVKEYINIHKLRFNNTIYIDYDEEGYMFSHRIVPMVLITLVENAVKHGLIDDPNFPLIIRASLIDDHFTFMVHNLKNLKPNGLDTKGNTGIGIINIEKRLAAVYKNGGYSLEKEETEDDYIVTFTVNFKETKR